jgi:hypothetical protein
VGADRRRPVHDRRRSGGQTRRHTNHDADDYLRIRRGELNPVTAAMPGGPMKIKGNYGMAIKFPTLFRRRGWAANRVSLPITQRR